MEFVVFVVVFGVFFLGLTLALQAIIGKEIGLPVGWGEWVCGIDDVPQVQYPRMRKRLRVVLIGLGWMVLAVVIGIVVW